VNLTSSSASTGGSANPFLLENTAAYRRWREWKLASYPILASDLVVPVVDPRALSAQERAAILKVLRKTNMAVYSTALGETEDKAIASNLGAQFGLYRLDANMLADEDAITSLQVVPAKLGRGYIPYSNRRLLWHTDGYYNATSQQIRGMVLHCVRPAIEGGESGLMDHEIAYILLRDASPDFVRALMQPDAMTIPANDESGERTVAVSGPVFSVDAATGTLHMRYTARTRSIVWKSDTAAAVKALEAVLGSDSPYIIRHRLGAGQGLLCNNVLHNRTAFTDSVDTAHKRLLYRARYFDRISGTEIGGAWNGGVGL
jgi:hypothetical protein